MEDVTRTIARILDGLRPQATAARGRPLQLFVGSYEEVLTAGEAASVLASGGTAKYGSGTYGVSTYGGLTLYGTTRYGTRIYGT